MKQLYITNLSCHDTVHSFATQSFLRYINVGVLHSMKKNGLLFRLLFLNMKICLLVLCSSVNKAVVE